MVKMMTAVLAMEYIERYGLDLDTELVDSTDKIWIFNVLADYRIATGSSPSTADIRRGETLSFRELLYATLLPSANEAALILADHVSGGYMENFMYQMNTRAQQLGCSGTYFADANGLSEANVTTAQDMVLIVREFMSYPELVEIASESSYQMAAHELHTEPYTIHTTNRLLVQTSPYYSAFSGAAGTVVAGKTGSLYDWQNFASMAQQDGESYICVVLGSPNGADLVGAALEPAQNRPALYESAQLYEWVFDSFEVRSAIDVEQPVTELRVRYSIEQDTVHLMPSDDVQAVLPIGASDELIRRNYELPPQLDAPVQQGDVVGVVRLSVEGQEIGTADLIVAQTLERNNTLYLFSRIGEFFTSTYVKVLLVLLIMMAAAYAALVVWAGRKRAQRKAQAAARGGAYRPKGGAQSAKQNRQDGKRR